MWLIVIAAVILIAVAGLLFRIQSLSSQVVSLEEAAGRASDRIASYSRTHCTEVPQSLVASDSTKEYIVTSSGQQRTYQVHTPENFDPTVRYPVIISFDGMEGSADRIEGYSGINTLPVIAVYPDALVGKGGFTAWQGAPYSLDGDYDIQFMRDLLDALPAHYCIDTTKVFALGMSNGGGFAMIAGCRMSDQFRAVASVSGAYYTPCKSERRTASFLVVHSTDDAQVPFQGSKERRLPEIPSWVREDSIARHCNSEQEPVLTATTATYKWSDCKNDSLLRLLVVQNQSHGWLDVPRDVERDASTTSEYIWRFFEESVYAG